MKTREFFFDLPDELIAQHPAAERGSSRLMILNRANGEMLHRTVGDLPGLLDPGSLLILNDTRVRKARLVGETLAPDSEATGDGGEPTNREADGQPGGVELLLVEQTGPLRWRALVSRAKRQRVGRRYRFDSGLTATVEGGSGPLRELLFSAPITDEYLERYGHVPLPPYIRRPDSPADADRYQTVYARHIGSIAAPTAGLHLTDAILDEIASRGVEIAYVTLHVGLGTFIPVRTDDVEAHEMHREEYEVPTETADRIRRARKERRRVVAVGTTSVRTLESAWNGTDVAAGRSSTGIFIYPGYEFKVVDSLFTNFHTPESTLVMLVAAFAGRERILAAYREAVALRYRFFSYGDAMLIR